MPISENGVLEQTATYPVTNGVTAPGYRPRTFITRPESTGIRQRGGLVQHVGVFRNCGFVISRPAGPDSASARTCRSHESR